MTWRSVVNAIIGVIIGIIIGNTVKDKEIKEVIKVIYRDSIIRDSIYQVNDSIKTVIVRIGKDYDEKVNIIMDADDSLQLDMWSRYIESYNRTNQNR